MIDALVRASIAHRRAVLIATLAFAILAAVFGAGLELDALPDITGNQVLILTTAPGFTPEEIELRVTKPIESAVSGLPGVERERSVSRYGISSVTVLFDDATPPFLARQLVAERLSTLRLPNGSDPPALGPFTGGLGEIYHFTLRSDRRTPAEILELVELEIAPILRTVRGVVEVNTWGGAKRSFDVRLEPTRLIRHQLSSEQVAEALSSAVDSAPGASVPSGASQSILRAVFRPDSPAELSAILIPTASHPVRLGDLGAIEEGQLPRIGAASGQGRGEIVYVMVQMLRGANALQVLEEVHAKMATVRRVLPDDVVLEPVYDRSTLVRRTLRTVFSNLLEGGALVGVVLFLLLGSLRAGLITALVIPLSMLGAVLGMRILGVPGNLMSLGAIDFGLLVDGAVVMVEAYFHGRDGEAALVRMARPVFYSVAIILLVYVPVMGLSGVDGKMFRPMATTVILALSVALLLSITFVPAAARTWLTPASEHAVEPLLVRFGRRLYRPVLEGALAQPKAVMGGAISLLALGMGLFLRAETAFVPELDEGDLVVMTTRSPDTSLASALEASRALERSLLGVVPEVERVAARIGSPAVATDIMGLEQADVFIGLASKDRWRAGLSKDALIDEIRARIEAAVPSAELAFTQPIQMRMNELIGGDTTDVSVSVFGPDLAALRRIAEAARAALQRVEGVADVRINVPPDVPLIEVRPQALAAEAVGLSPRAILNSARALELGQEVAETYQGRVRLPIRLKGAQDPTAFTLADTLIPTPAGALVPLASVATVDTVSTPSLISHEDGQRRVVVGLNVRGRSLGEVAVAAEKALAPLEAQHPGTRWVWGGQFETFTAAKRRMGWIIPLVMVSILSVLALTFGRLRPAILIFLNVPFAAVGGVLALSLRGLPVSISAAIGFIALSGIAVLNGVVLMSQILAEEARGAAPAEAARRAGDSRMRPVLMTASVAALGFLPMMLATGVGAEVQRPLATVVVGGLVTSTLLTLVILPSLYGWLFGARKKA
ncbi:MAG: CusA/CzcA family heavy metal efflux RND transporter [Myxococcota bacterium]